MYKCDNIMFGMMRAEYVWYLSRDPTMSSNIKGALDTKLKNSLPNYNTNVSGLWGEYLVEVPQGWSTCNYPAQII